MARLAFFSPPAGRPGKRWRYLVHHHLTLPGGGGWYFTSRLDAAAHARRCEMSSGGRYMLVDRALQSKETSNGG